MGIKGKVEKNYWLDAEGSFTAKLTKVDEKSGKFSSVVQFTFEILNNSEHEGKEVSGITSLKVTPDNKTAKWIVALDPNFDFEIDKEFDFESLIGKVCRILVEENDGDGGRTYCNVMKCRPLKSEEQTSLKKTMESKPKAEEKKEEKKEKKTKPAADEDIDF